MERTALKDSGIIFKEDTHQYFRQSDGKELQGITGVISRQLFPHEYDSVPKRILEAAAEYGKSIHTSCEKFDKEWKHDGTVELQDYIDICKEFGLVHVDSEYLISDGEHYASSIDKVFKGEDANSYQICDLKSYYGKLKGEKLERCRWQLSIYRALFLKQNPKAKVEKLFVIHLRNKQKKDGTFDHIKQLIEVDPIPENICFDLLAADIAGEQFKNPFAVPEDIIPQLSKIKELIELKNQTEEELNALKANIMSSMQFLEITNWATPEVSLTMKAPTTRSSFDLKSFKAAHSEINDYDQFMKTSRVAGSLMVKIAA